MIEPRSRTKDALILARIAVAAPMMFLTAGSIIWALAASLPGRRRNLALARLTARLIAWTSRWRLSVEGLDKLPADGPFILVANHASYADIPALVALLPLDFLFVAKKEAASWPFFGTFIRRSGHFVVDRGNVRSGVPVARELVDAVRRGEHVLFFPEGTLGPESGLRPFRLGAFRTAVASGAAVVPLALRGTRRVLRKGQRLPRPGTVHLWIGEPIRPDGDSRQDAIALRDRVAQVIAAHCAERLP